MKHYIFAAAVFVNVAYQKCNGTAVDTIPSCIQARIAEIKKQPRWNPPAQVEEYRFEGKRVFLFSSNCCDQYNVIYDKNCAYICAPSGGITGKGDGKCADFLSAAQKIKLIWKDDRSRKQ